MNKYILLIAAAVFFFLNSKAQDYKQMQEQVFTQFDTTAMTNTAGKMEYSNKLGLISKKWADEWTAHYYNAYSKAILSYGEKDEAKRDAYLNDAESEYTTAVELLKKETDETHVLAAMIANGRLAVKPQSRWQKYGKIFDDELEKAKEINPNNPRIYYLRGTQKFFTPKMFGGGKKAARPYFEKAEELFAKETTRDITAPHWGKEANAYFLKEAGGED